MSVPSVTVVIPCFNHGRFVAEAVRSCLTQVNADVRVMIVDDGSDDGSTPDACDRCLDQNPTRVAVIHQNNRGLAAARNRGAAEARARGGDWAGEYLVFLDSDDWLEPTFVSRLHEAIVAGDAELVRERRSRKGSSAVSSPAVRALHNGDHRDGPPNGAAAAVLQDSDAPDPDESPDPLNPHRVSHAYCQERLVELAQMIWAVPEWDPLLMMVTNLHPVTTLVRRECFEAVGGFDQTMREGYEDWDMWLKFVERGWKGARVREPLFIWRRHSAVTMIVEAGRRHERLFGRLVTNHLDMYLRHGPQLLVLSNHLLRQSDANWLDESGEAIVVRDLRNYSHMITVERDALRNEVGVVQTSLRLLQESAQAREHDLLRAVELERSLRPAAEQAGRAAAAAEFAQERVNLATRIQAITEQLNTALAEVESARRQAAQTARDYESKPVIRASRRLHSTLDRLPAWVRRPVKLVGRAAARLVGG